MTDSPKTVIDKPVTLRGLISRVPDRKNITLLFLSTIFLFHIWSIPVFLYQVPGMILYMDIRDLLQVASYNQALTLLECILITSILIFISIVLPPQYLKDHFVLQGNFMVFLTGILSILLNRSEPFILKVFPSWFDFVNQLDITNPLILGLMSSDSFMLSVLLFLIFSIWISLLIFSPKIIRRASTWHRSLLNFFERAAVLSGLFLVADFIGLFLVTIGNLKS